MRHVKRVTSEHAFSRIGEYFKYKRIDADLTQGQVAEALGLVSGQFISNWERGRSLPPMDYLPKLVKLYRLNRAEVLKLYVEEQKIFIGKILYK